ncbi:MAG: NTP transferase domain-containing protein [Bacteroidales bacterium]|nr:NTP transferase domain-containing protein [Bacteroidales bacterium]
MNKEIENNKKQRSSVIILAAGRSVRMGKPKIALQFSEEDTFIDHIIKVYQKFGVHKIILVVNDLAVQNISRDEDQLIFVVNPYPEFGRFYSIRLGLKELGPSPVFIQNVDNPFVNPGLLMMLEAGIKDGDFSTPVYKSHGGHPVLVSGRIVPKLINDFNKDDRFDEVLKLFDRRIVNVNDPYITVNINTPEDYEEYFAR